MRLVFLVLLLGPTFAAADQVADSIARSREKLGVTPLTITDESRDWLRKQQEEKERQRIERLLPPTKPGPELEPSVEQRVVDDLRRRGVK